MSARPPSPRVIHLQVAAPAMPQPGQACNGCGVCCALEPCPLGMVVSLRRRGSCVALAWDDALGLYRCNMVAAPQAVWPALPARWSTLVSRLARRWISAASGCDAGLQTEPAPASGREPP